MGIRTSNTVPTPNWLLTVIVPPSRSIRRFVIAIPSPLPSIWSIRLSLSRVNGSKICSRYSGLIPIPLSDTVKQIMAFFADSVSCISIFKMILPSLGVNFEALERRLRRIWRKRSASLMKFSQPGPSRYTSNL